MPIAPELRHFYAGSSWREIRQKVFSRAEHCCERCGKPDAQDVLATSTAWYDAVTKRWIRPGSRLVDRRPPVERGVPCLRPCEPATIKRAQLGCAHINHRAGDDRPKNLAAWCRECHLLYDRDRHAETRKEKKDARRPLLTAARAIDQQCAPQLSSSRRKHG